MELFSPLNIRQLMHSQEAVTELHAGWVYREQDSLHHVGDENYHHIQEVLLAVEEARLLICDACSAVGRRSLQLLRTRPPGWGPKRVSA